MSDHILELKLAGVRGELKKGIREVKEFLQSRNAASPDIFFRVELCLRELLANALEHGCKNIPEASIKLEIKIKKDWIGIRVSDPGQGFDTSSLELNKMPLLEEKGRGLPLVNSTADHLGFADGGSTVEVRIDRYECGQNTGC